jgi:hypothetical protein
MKFDGGGHTIEIHSQTLTLRKLYIHTYIYIYIYDDLSIIYYETDLKQSKVFGGSATKFSPNGDVEYWVYHINSHPRLMFHAVSPTSWIPAPVPQDEAIKSPAVSDCFW